MRLCASVLAIAVLLPIRAFAQAPADQPPAAAPAMAAPPPPAPPPPAPPPPPPMAAPAPPPAAAAPAPTWKDLITVGGLVDAYYQYNFNGADSRTSPAGANPAAVGVRSFDTNSNAFTLNYAKLSTGIAPKPVGFQFDFGYGATAVAVNGTAPQFLAAGAGTSAGIVNGGSSPFLAEQAYVTASFGNLTLDLGKFTTWAGAEVIEANLNPNYSRSIMFFYIPLVHTGLRASYQATPELAVKAAVVNGWNDVGFEGDINSAKTLGFEINYLGADTTNIILNGYFGKEFTDANWRSLIDLVAARTMGPLMLNLNVDYIKETASTASATVYDGGYFGVAAMGKYTVNDKFAVAARGEYVSLAPAGADRTGLYEGTVTGIAPLGGRMEIRVELRGDFSNQQVFNVPADPKKNQFTGTGAFLAWF